MAPIRIMAPGKVPEPFWCMVAECGRAADYAALCLLQDVTVSGILCCQYHLEDVLCDLNTMVDRFPEDCQTVALRLP